jgi:cyclopropane-fatty-acyl-phospholipid synthase
MTKTDHLTSIGGLSAPVQSRAPADHHGNRFVQKFLDVIGNLSAGRLTLITPDGASYVFAGAMPAPEAVIRIHRWRAVRRFLTEGEFGFIEAYLDGDWESPELADLIELAARNGAHWNSGRLQNMFHRLRHRLGHLMRRNSRRGSRRNIAAHYDLGNTFYSMWLDQTMTYSSAVFSAPSQSLSEAQVAKYRRIAQLLELRPGHHVLEVGCGWGGFAEFAAKEYGCRLTALTLSRQQMDFAGERIQREGLSGKVEVRLQDYRDVTGTFDRVASIEMFEAVGEAYWPCYFDMIRERLVRGGVAALQIITIADGLFAEYRRNPGFIQRYIFPGSMVPAMSALTPQFDRAGLQLANVTTFGGSYAVTLRTWRERFLTAWAKIEPLGFDTRFRRMWEMYLAYCEGGFRAGALDVGQLKLIRA